MFKKSLLALVALVTLTTAQAAIHLEPFLGHTLSGTVDDSKEDTYSAVNYGARVGYGMLGFSGGVSYTMGTVEREITFGKLRKVTDWEFTALGAYVAYEFPILLRAFATYNFSTTFTDSDDVKLNGGGFSVGAGYTGLAMLAINIEYRMTTSTKREDAAGKRRNLGADVKASDLFISVSLPFDL